MITQRGIGTRITLTFCLGLRLWLLTSPSPRAASLGHFEVLQVLSAYGADFTVATSSGENAMHFATMAGKLLCIRFLGQRGVWKECIQASVYLTKELAGNYVGTSLTPQLYGTFGRAKSNKM